MGEGVESVLDAVEAEVDVDVDVGGETKVSDEGDTFRVLNVLHELDKLRRVDFSDKVVALACGLK